MGGCAAQCDQHQSASNIVQDYPCVREEENENHSLKMFGGSGNICKETIKKKKTL